jgi:hypothetical protein
MKWTYSELSSDGVQLCADLCRRALELMLIPRAILPITRRPVISARHSITAVVYNLQPKQFNIAGLHMQLQTSVSCPSLLPPLVLFDALLLLLENFL